MFEVRGLNSNETYCCSPKEVKSLFKNEKIDIHFGYSLSRNPVKNSKYYLSEKKKNCIAVAYIRVFRPYKSVRNSWEDYSWAGFFILHKSMYTEELREEFRTKVLPYMKEFYDKHKDDDCTDANVGAAYLAVAIENDKFVFEETRIIMD